MYFLDAQSSYLSFHPFPLLFVSCGYNATGPFLAAVDGEGTEVFPSIVLRFCVFYAHTLVRRACCDTWLSWPTSQLTMSLS